MNVYILEYVRVSIHIYLNLYDVTCACAYIYIYTHTHTTCTYTCMCICIYTHAYVLCILETWGAGVETQENNNICVPLSKKDKNKKSNERWT